MERTKSKTVERVKTALSQKHQKSEITYDGDFNNTISTGSTLLDLAISGEIIHGGGIPTGIAVEIFGDSSAGKTVLMCEIAGAIQRKGGDVIFNDPEARLNKEFAALFDFSITDKTIKEPDTIAEVFNLFDSWKPAGDPPHAIIADSIAALCTEEEMKDAKGYDGAKRANDFSQGFRRTCRMLKQRGWLMVFSNQIRDTMATMPFAKKTKATGGHAPKFYASLRLEIVKKQVIKAERNLYGKEHKESIGILSHIDVVKSSVGKGYRSADIYIMDNYGIDDIRANLVFLKQNSQHKKYSIDGEEILSNSLDGAISYVEENGIEEELKEAVIELWEEIQAQFVQDRMPKRRI